jgi:hypothetical protein
MADEEETFVCFSFLFLFHEYVLSRVGLGSLHFSHFYVVVVAVHFQEGSVERKGLKMQRKSVEVQRRFNLPDTESVIQGLCFCESHHREESAT